MVHTSRSTQTQENPASHVRQERKKNKKLKRRGAEAGQQIEGADEADQEAGPGIVTENVDDLEVRLRGFG